MYHSVRIIYIKSNHQLMVSSTAIIKVNKRNEEWTNFYINSRFRLSTIQIKEIIMHIINQSIKTKKQQPWNETKNERICSSIRPSINDQIKQYSSWSPQSVKKNPTKRRMNGFCTSIRPRQQSINNAQIKQTVNAISWTSDIKTNKRETKRRR